MSNKQELIGLCLDLAKQMLRPEVYSAMEQDRVVEYGLSRILALASDYDGDMIIKAAYLGLTDINWHPEAYQLKINFKDTFKE